MARGRESFKYCKQMDLMRYHTGMDHKDPVPTSPLANFLIHMKGQKKLKDRPELAEPSVFPSVLVPKENK